MVTPNYEAATQIVKELFGTVCLYPRMPGATMEPIPCGKCLDCLRDWTPEAKAIVDASLITTTENM